MIRVFTFGAFCLALTVPASAHESEGGEACHMGPHRTSSGAIMEMWGCHKRPQTIDRRASPACERAKQKLMQARQMPMSRHEKRVRLDIPVYCADTTERGHAELCESLRRKILSFEASKRSSFAWWRKKVATDCAVVTPKEQRQNRRNATCQKSRQELERNLRAGRNPNVDASAGIRFWRARVAKDCL